MGRHKTTETTKIQHETKLRTKGYTNIDTHKANTEESRRKSPIPNTKAWIFPRLKLMESLNVFFVSEE